MQPDAKQIDLGVRKSLELRVKEFSAKPMPESLEKNEGAYMRAES